VIDRRRGLLLGRIHDVTRAQGLEQRLRDLATRLAHRFSIAATSSSWPSCRSAAPSAPYAALRCACSTRSLKAINDEHGHAVGDRRAAADSPRAESRAQATARAHRREEFAVLLPRHDAGSAMRWRSAFAALWRRWAQTNEQLRSAVRPTVSVGLSARTYRGAVVEECCASPTPRVSAKEGGRTASAVTQLGVVRGTSCFPPASVYARSPWPANARARAKPREGGRRRSSLRPIKPPEQLHRRRAVRGTARSAKRRGAARGVVGAQSPHHQLEESSASSCSSACARRAPDRGRRAVPRT